MTAASVVTYELCRTGLVIAKEKPKYQRVATGCLECKKRKKKCDEQRPICSRCLRHRSSTSECTWPQSSTPQSSIHSESLSLEWGDQETTKFVHENSNHPCGNSMTASQSTARLFTPRPFFKGISTEVLEEYMFQALMSRCEALTSNSYFNKNFSFPSLVVPLTISFPATKSAVLACGAVLLANLDIAWIPMAQYYHTQTIQIIQTSLMSNGREEIVSAIMLLHLYEELRADSKWPTHIHLAGAHELILSMMDQTPPTIGYQQLMIEVYLYHVAVSSTFTDTSPISFDFDTCFERYLKFLEKSPGSVDILSSRSCSTILDVPSEILGIVVRLSSLRRCIPLLAQDEIRAIRIYSKLEAYLTASIQIGTDFDQPTSPGNPLQFILMGELYYLACLLLLEKILNPSLQAHDTGIRKILQRALTVWSKFVAAGFKSPTSKWPLVILGCGAFTESERQVFQKPFKRLSSLGVGGAHNILVLFEQAWGTSRPGQPSTDGLGLDVLLRKDLLLPILV